MTRYINSIQPLPDATLARLIRDDRDNYDWMAGHLALQQVALHEAGRDYTAAAHYVRAARIALSRADTQAYNNSLDELLSVLDKAVE